MERKFFQDYEILNNLYNPHCKDSDVCIKFQNLFVKV